METLPLSSLFYYQLNDVELEFVKCETNLGVTVTSTLNFNEHSLKLYSKASSRLGLLKGVCLNIVVLSGTQQPTRQSINSKTSNAEQLNGFSLKEDITTMI